MISEELTEHFLSHDYLVMDLIRVPNKPKTSKLLLLGQSRLCQEQQTKIYAYHPLNIVR